jgi:hypothetical protein
VRAEPSTRICTEANGREAQEALSLSGVGVLPADSRQRQFVHRAGRLAHQPQALSGREAAPRFYLAVLDLDGGVGREDRLPRWEHRLGHVVIVSNRVPETFSGRGGCGRAGGGDA